MDLLQCALEEQPPEEWIRFRQVGNVARTHVAVVRLTDCARSWHAASAMKQIRMCGCAVCIMLAIGLPTFGQDLDPADAEWVRTGMTIAVAGAGLATGIAMGIGFSLDAIDTPLSDTLRLTIPVAAAGAAAGAFAGHWIAEVVLKHQPSPLFSVIEGAGLGCVAGACVGAVTFTLHFVLAYPILEVPEGYWGRFDYPQTVGLAIVAGGFWGGFIGMIAGAAALPVVSLLMGF